MSDKMKNLTVRSISGLILAVVVLGAILWSQASFGLLLAVLIFGGLNEFYALARSRGVDPQQFMGWVSGLVFLLLNYMFVSDDIQVLGSEKGLFGAGLAFWFLLLPVMFFCELWRKRENPLANIAVTMMGVTYVAIPFSLLLYFPILATEVWTPAVMIGYIFIVWANDVFAYLVGMTIGRHKLFERISPKKSWEGFFGGVIGAMLMGVGIAHFLEMNPYVWMGLSIVVAATAVLGDLVESMFKRAAEVKDSGNVIPGHGGVLDRFDAMLLSAPFVLVYMLFVM